jgi:hypothetical protein
MTRNLGFIGPTIDSDFLSSFGSLRRGRTG